MNELLVSLSFAEERRELVESVAEQLAAVLGRERVFFYPYHRAETARPDLALHLQSLYHDRSRLVAVFVDQHYARKRWCQVEWQAIREMADHNQAKRVMLIRVGDGDVPGLRPYDGYLEARALHAAEIAGLILDRLGWTPAIEPPAWAVDPLKARLIRPGILRRILDHAAPGLHRALAQAGLLPAPPELPLLESWLGHLEARIGQEVWEKTYLPLQARTVPPGPGDERAQDLFLRFVHLRIRRILGSDKGGDAATAQIAAVNRRSRLVRRIVHTLLNSPDPLVLLGEPGGGKTMTLQKAALTLLRSERRRVFPRILITARLGEFHVEGPVDAQDVLTFVKRSCPVRLRPWLDELDRHGRLVVFFDGMDEMSRERYTEHTEALSLFAREHRRGTRTLFSCRITDFSPALKHRRLVLLPLDRGQIRRFLRLYLPASKVEIDGRTWSLSHLARRLATGDLPVDTGNPFVLWLLCLYLQERRTWPSSRVEMLRFFLLENHERKRRDAEAEGRLLPSADDAFRAWSHLAYLITERNRGSDLPGSALLAGAGPEEARQTLAMIRTGRDCGVLAESLEETEYQVRFEHHRFQEYFAALWIHENRPEIDWMGRLDSPRWQETMLNLVLLGGAEEGVRALAAVIEAETASFEEVFALADAATAAVREQAAKEQRKEESKEDLAETVEDGEKKRHDTDQVREPEVPAVDYARESLLADRVELGARLLRHGQVTSAAVRDHLRPALQGAVELLAERGRPITQVKTMRACQHLGDVDLLRVLVKPLRSPVQWVRDQALILIANPPSGLPGASNLPTEIGVDLGTGSLLQRWPVYLRMAAANRDPRLWTCFFLATLCALLEVALLLGSGWALFDGGRVGLLALRDSEWTPVLSNLAVLSPAVASGLQTLLTLLALAVGFRASPARLWLWVLGSAPLGLLLLVLGGGLWRGDLDSIGLALDWWTPFAVLGLSLLITVLGSLAHLGPVGIYALATRRWREDRQASLLSLAWSSGDFGPTLNFCAALVGVVVFLIGIALLLIGLESPLDWLERTTGSFFDWLFAMASTNGEQVGDTVTMVLAGAVAIGMIALFVQMIREGDTVTCLGWSGGCLLLLCGLLGVIAFLDSFGLYLMRALVLVMVLTLAGVVLRELSLQFTKLLSFYRDLPPDSLSPEQWKRSMSKSRRQENLLRRTTHRSLGLKPDEYLRLLVEIEPLVKKEPALSTYWSRRDEIEQALRQERQG